jgi:3-oxoisoapionate kinase
MSAKPACRLVFYGDDFTGSTDALEVLAFAGLRCALFLNPPTDETLAQFREFDAAGVAGDSRGMNPEEMNRHLPAVFDAIAKVGAPIIHYKVCSTFDSSPTIGSIGRVMELARDRFPGGFIPIVAGTPGLARYCLFGHLFARSGTDGQIYRIDRHPIMSVHPVTPMDESDLALHLARQGKVSIAKLTYPQLDEGRDAAERHLRDLAATGADAILFDTAWRGHLTEAARLLTLESERRAPVFVVGGSGVEYALTQWWRESEELAEVSGQFDTIRPVDRILAVSGSASKLSAAQIEAAIEAGFAELPVSARDFVDDDRWRDAAASLSARAASLLAEGRSVILHTARGPDDPRIEEMLDALATRGLSRGEAKFSGGRTLGVRLGNVIRDILALQRVSRIGIAGGDTSSQTMQVLGPDALEVAARLTPGAPLCRTLSRSPESHGIEVALKGGQMGGRDFFERLRTGGRA